MPNSYRKSGSSRQRSWRKRLIQWGGLVVLILCIGLGVSYFGSRDLPETAPVVENTSSQRTREMTLYFASTDGQALIAEARRINECQSDEGCLRDVVEALIAGPQSDLVPILPSQVVLRGISVSDSLVIVDFSQEIMTAHPGGTQSELLTIYGLADTLTVNFPHLRQMRILVDGAPVATLKGHVDLRQPINPDFSLVEEGLAPAGKMLSLPVGRDE